VVASALAILMQTAEDALGNRLGMCCDNNDNVAASWGRIADIMSRTRAPASGTNDAVWTVNKVCGCNNQWVR